MKVIITVLGFLQFSLLFAQADITGYVLDSETNEGLPYCLVQLYDADTDSLLAFTNCNDSGLFKFSQPIENPFVLRTRMMAYLNYESPVFSKPLEKPIELKIKADSKMLDEVSLLKKERLIRLEGDKMIYDVQKSGLADGNSAMEVLRRIPGMRTDKDDNLIFRGNGQLQILINGKPSLLEGEALKAFLKSLNGEELAFIEIITNPSAKYDAEGSAGILNIKLKKSYKQGFSGTLYGGIGYGDFPKNHQGLNVYNQTGKWNFNAGLYHGYSESVNNRRVIQNSTVDSTENELKQFNDWLPKTRWYSAKSAFSYEVYDGLDLGGSINFSQSTGKEETIGLTEEWTNGNYDRYTTLFSSEDWTRNTVLSNLFIKQLADSGRQVIDFQVNFASYQRSQSRITRNNYLSVDDDMPWRDELALHANNPTDFTIFSSRLDFEKSLNKIWKLESGLKFSTVNNTYDIRLETEDFNGNLVLDSALSDHLEYSEQNAAIYAILNASLKNWTFQFGLRTEYIQFIGNSEIRPSNTDQYFSFFPSFSINRELGEQQFKLGYSRRIRRPRYMDLNPYFNFVDTYNVQIGNPNLQPQFSNNFDFTWIPNDLISFSAYGNFASKVMYSILRYDAETKRTTMFQDNIAKSDAIGFSANKTIELKDYWDLDLYGDFAFNRISSNLDDFSFDERGHNWYLNLSSIWTLPKDWTINYSAHYSSGGQYGNSRDRASYDMTFSIRKLFLAKKLRVTVKARDVLKTNVYRSVTTQDNLITDWTNRWETRVFSLSLSYNFGAGKRKSIKKADVNDEEERM